MSGRRETVYEFEAGNRLIRASINQYRGRTYLDIRQLWEPELGAEMLPTKRGISVPSDCLDELQQCLDAFKTALGPRAA